MTKTISKQALQEKAERYARTIITYESRGGTSRGDIDRMPVTEAFIEGYLAATRDRREYDVHQLDCHPDCHAGKHNKACQWKREYDRLDVLRQDRWGYL